MSRNVKFRITATQTTLAAQLAEAMGVDINTLANMAFLALLKDSLKEGGDVIN